MSNKDRDFYEIKWRFGSKNKPSAFIPLFIVTLHTKDKDNQIRNDHETFKNQNDVNSLYGSNNFFYGTKFE